VQESKILGINERAPIYRIFSTVLTGLASKVYDKHEDNDEDTVSLWRVDLVSIIKTMMESEGLELLNTALGIMIISFPSLSCEFNDDDVNVWGMILRGLNDGGTNSGTNSEMEAFEGGGRERRGEGSVGVIAQRRSIHLCQKILEYSATKPRVKQPKQPKQPKGATKSKGKGGKTKPNMLPLPPPSSTTFFPWQHDNDLLKSYIDCFMSLSYVGRASEASEIVRTKTRKPAERAKRARRSNTRRGNHTAYSITP